MKFISKQLNPKNVNVSSHNPVKDFIDLLWRILVATILVYIILGFVVDYFAPRISPSTEDKIAKLLLNTFRAKPLKAQDKDNLFLEKETLANEVLQKLIRHAEVFKDRKFQVHVIEGKPPNALAFPGGNIVLYNSLFDVLKTENELAMVLGHELAHYAHRDHLRGMGRSLVFLTLTVLLIGADQQAGKVWANPIMNIDLSYSRSQEERADKFGMDLLFRTYGHVGGAYGFFDQDKKRSKLPSWLYVFSSHDSSSKRILNLRDYAHQKTYKEKDCIDLKKEVLLNGVKE